MSRQGAEELWLLETGRGESTPTAVAGGLGSRGKKKERPQVKEKGKKGGGHAWAGSDASGGTEVKSSGAVNGGKERGETWGGCKKYLLQPRNELEVL